MDLYQQNILDYYKRPRKQAPVSGATHVASASNPLCGDRIDFEFVISDEKIIKVGWQGEGCVLSLASADMLAEHLEGKGVVEIRPLNKEWLIKTLGVNPSPSRLKCALLPLEAINQLIIKN